MSVTLDKRILQALIAVVGLIASGAVIAECPDPVGRWTGTFQTYIAEGDASPMEPAAEVWAVRIKADGTFRWRIRASVHGYRESEVDNGTWHVDRMTGSCMLHLYTATDYIFTTVEGPFVNKNTLELTVQDPIPPLRSGLGTLKRVTF